jgi:hypothetical protein
VGPRDRGSGLAERRTGLTCVGAQSAFSGRKRWEDRHPQAADALRTLAEAHAQQDPTFRTALAYTRLTAKAAVAALRAQGFRKKEVPAPSTMATILNRLGFRLRKGSKPSRKRRLPRPDFRESQRRRRRRGNVTRWSST